MGYLLMTPSHFKHWRKAQGLSRQAAAEALGLSFETIRLYETGYRRDSDRTPVQIPRTVSLACAALSAGLEGI